MATDPARARYLRALVDQQDRGRRAVESALTAGLLTTWRQFFLTDGQSVRSRTRRGSSLQARAAMVGGFAISAAQASLLYREDDAHALALRLAEQALDAQRQAYNLQREFQRRLLADFDVAAQPLTGTGQPTGRLGVDPAEVYLRPVESYRFERSRGTPHEEALQAASERLQRLAEDDVMLATRDGAMDVLEDDQLPVTEYRRIIHPELSASGTCGLCVVAADRVYKRGTLQALHGQCRCTVMPVVGGDDPGLELNTDDLANLYAAAGASAGKSRSTYAADLKQTRVTLQENGELGPVLTVRGNRFLTLDEVNERRRAPLPVGPPDWSSRQRDAVWLGNQLEQMRKRAAALEVRSAAGESVASPLEYHRKQIARFEQLLAAAR